MKIRSLLAASLATAVLTLGLAPAADAQPRAKPPFPQIELPEHANGQRAIELLGSRLPEVAAWYGKTPAELTSIFRRDRTAWVDRKGMIYHVEQFPVPATTITSAYTTTTTTPFPLDQTFRLHSRPGSSRTIYLDFDGHTATGTAWNASYGIDPIVNPAYDLDGVPGSFSNEELARIQQIFLRVAEDYAPFDVNVTTEEPTADRITRSSTSDAVFGTRVVITRDFTKSTSRPCSCGGFAYIGIFDSVGDYNKPAYVFYDNLGGGNEKYVAEAISHEAGHNVGLSHDGTSTANYYRGHGSGATGWAPIMGSGYYQELVQWSRGEYPDANNKEDDFAVMQNNGLPLMGDDHGSTTSAATRMPSTVSGGVASVSARGVIERASDVDVFSFVADPGSFSITVTPGLRAPNLDVIAELRDSAGRLIASSNPADALNATLSGTLPAAGTYYVTVNGTGKGDPLNGGYSDYGSLGAYTVSGTVPLSSSQPPVAQVSASTTRGTAPVAVSFSGTGSYDPDGTIASYVWNFGDGSPAVSGPTATYTYTQPGTYTATLTVTDNSGLTDSRPVTVDVTAPVTVTTMYVQGITVTVNVTRKSQYDAIASVEIRDTNGRPVSGASVSGTWSGAVSGSGSGTTSSTGVASIKSPRTRSSGTFSFAVTGVALSGYVYDATRNLETVDSASR